MLYTKGCSIYQYGGDYGCYGEHENHDYDDYDDDLPPCNLTMLWKELNDNDI